MFTLSTSTKTLQLRTKAVILYVNHDEVYVAKIAKIYEHNYISLKWLIHEVKMDMCRVQLKKLNILI